VRLAIIEAIQGAVLIGGFLSLYIAGVRLHIDRRRESFFMEVDPDADHDAIKAVGDFAEGLGFEVMPEWECPSEELDNGAIRHWMAEKEVVHDSSPLQTV
jgi:hypothetical protein